jgi:pimeloyl-ACP methyl ester carboxylesterase
MDDLINRAIFPPTDAHGVEVFTPLTKKKHYFEQIGETGIPCVIIGDEKPQNGTVLLFHGNAQTIDSAATIAFATSIARAAGVQVAITEYPGFWSDGKGTKKSVEGMYEACLSAARALSKQLGPLHVIGYSVGTAPASRVASRFPEGVRSLTLVAPMVSAIRVAEHHFPIFKLVSAISRPIDTLCVRSDAERTKQKRVLIVHGELDTLIPPEQGKEVHVKYIKNNVSVWQPVPGADHESVVTSEKCIESIAELIKTS